MMQDLRLSFAAGKTKDLRWRREQLTQLKKLVQENHEELTAAVRAGKNSLNRRQ